LRSEHLNSCFKFYKLHQNYTLLFTAKLFIKQDFNFIPNNFANYFNPIYITK